MSVHDETPAETIRRAIEEMRTDAGLIPSNDIWEPPSALAAADLLEAIGAALHFATAAPQGELLERERAALRLARTYLGETP